MSVIDSVLSNATVTGTGSHVFRAGSAPEAVLVWNIAGPFTGSADITFSLFQVDPADETTPIGETVFGVPINGPGVGTIKIGLTDSPTVVAHWTINGTSIAGVTASIFWQDLPSNQTVSLVASDDATVSTVTRNNTVALAVESRPLESLLNSILAEIRILRRHVETITGEDDPL